MKSPKRAFGDIGEKVACAFLEKQGFKILDRNYLKKWGEIDIVADKNNGKGRVIHFVEVKSMSIDASIRAEENLHPGKLRRLQRTIETYLLDKKINADWQLDLVIVRIDEVNRKATAEMLQNVA